MPEERKDETEERDDASAGTLLKTAIDRLDSLHKRMDAMEDEKKAKKDSEEEERKDARSKKDEDEKEEKKDSRKDEDEDRKDSKARKDEEDEKKADKSRKDKEEDEDDSTVFYRGNKAPKDSKKDEDEERKDNKRNRKDEDEDEKMADSMLAVSERIARVERLIPKELTAEDRAKYSEVQARADAVFHAFGEAAPGPLTGETLLAYRQRLANSLKSHSKIFKDVNVYAIGDDVAFKAIEDVVYTDAMGVAMSPSTVASGQLRAISKKTGGHEFITYVGDPASWMNEFAGPVRQYVTNINSPNTSAR